SGPVPLPDEFYISVLVRRQQHVFRSEGRDLVAGGIVVPAIGLEPLFPGIVKDVDDRITDFIAAANRLKVSPGVAFARQKPSAHKSRAHRQVAPIKAQPS